MTVVRRGREGLALVAARTGGIRLLDLQPMRVMTIATDDAGRVHLALQERAPDVDFVEDLTVRVVQTLFEQGGAIAIEEGLGREAFGDLRAARVAGGADFDLARGLAGRYASGDRASGLEAPGMLRAEGDPEPAPRDLGVGAGLRPGDVRRARPMTGLAGDIDLRPARRVGLARGVVVLPEVRGVAVGAHRIPAARRARPVQQVAWRHGFVGLQMEPSLTSLALGARIPGDAQGLQATAAERHQVLLERRDAEGVADLELAGLSFGIGGLDEESPIASAEAKSLAVVLDGRVVEIAEHALGRGVLHREVVMRSPPEARLLGMAGRTGLDADVARHRRGARCQGRRASRLLIGPLNGLGGTCGRLLAADREEPRASREERRHGSLAGGRKTPGTLFRSFHRHLEPFRSGEMEPIHRQNDRSLSETTSRNGEARIPIAGQSGPAGFGALMRKASAVGPGPPSDCERVPLGRLEWVMFEAP